MDILDRRGDFIDEVEAEVRDSFLPWVSDELEVALEVKETLYELKKAGLSRAIEIRNGRIRKFHVDVEVPKVVIVNKKAAMLRGMLVEDRGSMAIRKARREYIERKEREAAEAAARAQAESAAISEAEEAAAAERAQRDGDTESYSETRSSCSHFFTKTSSLMSNISHSCAMQLLPFSPSFRPLLRSLKGSPDRS
jgi:flagellar biosynthesis/type III secretory pathway protein FliH